MDEEEEFEQEERSWVTPRRLQKIDFLILGLEFCRQIASAVEDTLASAVMLTAAHANHKVEQREFQEEAMLEIETITGDEDG